MPATTRLVATDREEVAFPRRTIGRLDPLVPGRAAEDRLVELDTYRIHAYSSVVPA